MSWSLTVKFLPVSLFCEQLCSCFILLSRRSRQRERLSASVVSICSSVCSFVCLSVCRQNAKKRYFYLKIVFAILFFFVLMQFKLSRVAAFVSSAIYSLVRECKDIRKLFQRCSKYGFVKRYTLVILKVAICRPVSLRFSVGEGTSVSGLLVMVSSLFLRK